MTLSRWPVVLLAALALIAAGAGRAGAQTVSLGPPVVLDGPDAGIMGLSSLSIAHDGSGGLVYLKRVGGTAHVFLSSLQGGAFSAPVEVDSGLASDSSSPVIAAGNGGLVVIAFVSSSELYVTTRPGTGAALTSPLALAAGASSPAMAITALGKAYLAFTQAGQGGHDVRAAYYYRGDWGLASGPLDAQAADDAGTGTGRPAVAAAGDGVGIFAWGESGHVYTRRVWGTSPSVVFEQTDVPSLGGWSEVSADSPALGVGGDSSYVAVGFRERLSNGSKSQDRVLEARLRGSRYDQLQAADGLSGSAGSDGAGSPAIASDEYGTGLLISTRGVTHDVYVMRVGQNDYPGPVMQLNGLPNASDPNAAVAPGGYYSGLVAWQHDPGNGIPEIRARFFDGGTFGPELVASTPAAGPAAADLGLLAGGDIAADEALAWVQGAAGARQIVTAQLYQPPGGFTATRRFAYSRSARPALSWNAARELWPPLSYAVSIDGGAPLTTQSTSYTAPSLSDGPHSWQVTATNRAGLQSTMAPATVWVDTVAPAARFVLSGLPYSGRVVHLTVSYTDSPPPEPAAAASGVASVRVWWGDGRSAKIAHGKYHVYRRPGRYHLSIIVADRAGNRTRLARTLHIRRRPAPSHSTRR